MGGAISKGEVAPAGEAPCTLPVDSFGWRKASDAQAVGVYMETLEQKEGRNSKGEVALAAKGRLASRAAARGHMGAFYPPSPP